ncbi:UDP-glucose 6-dehydrogenase TuaD [compost metagenome]
MLTEWKEFAQVDLTTLAQTMKEPVMIDGRNVYSAEQIQASAFHYYSVGRPGLVKVEGKATAII